MTKLATFAPTLAAYKPLDAGLLKIGDRWLVFIDGNIINEEKPARSRLEALDLLTYYEVRVKQERIWP